MGPRRCYDTNSHDASKSSLPLKLAGTKGSMRRARHLHLGPVFLNSVQVSQVSAKTEKTNTKIHLHIFFYYYSFPSLPTNHQVRVERNTVYKSVWQVEIRFVFLPSPEQYIPCSSSPAKGQAKKVLHRELSLNLDRLNHCQGKCVYGNDRPFEINCKAELAAPASVSQSLPDPYRPSCSSGWITRPSWWYITWEVNILRNNASPKIQIFVIGSSTLLWLKDDYYH